MQDIENLDKSLFYSLFSVISTKYLFVFVMLETVVSKEKIILEILCLRSILISLVIWLVFV